MVNDGNHNHFDLGSGLLEPNVDDIDDLITDGTKNKKGGRNHHLGLTDEASSANPFIQSQSRGGQSSQQASKFGKASKQPAPATMQFM